MREKSQKKMTKMKLNNTLVTLCLVLIMTILAFDYGAKYGARTVVGKSDTVYTTRTDTLWQDTTIFQEKIKEKKIVEVKRDTVYKENGDTLQLITESKTFEKSFVSAKDTADVTIYTTGINTSLDSLKLRLKTHTEVITNTVEVTKYVEKPKTLLDRIHIQPQVTSGYDLINKQWGITAGIGVGIDL